MSTRASLDKLNGNPSKASETVERYDEIKRTKVEELDHEKQLRSQPEFQKVQQCFDVGKNDPNGDEEQSPLVEVLSTFASLILRGFSLKVTFWTGLKNTHFTTQRF